MIKLNYQYTILFASTVAGVGTAADSTPTAVLWRNGSASGVSVVVSTTAQTGLYKAVFTTNSGWAAADFLELYATATIAGTAGYLAKLWSSTDNGAVALDSAAIRAALGMAAADLDTQLDAILAGGGGSGTGARTVTITVNDGTTVLQNATVRMTEGANTFTALTNVSGVAVFNLDDATYTVGVTKSGYTYAGTTLVVDGTEVATYSMTAVSITPPSNPSLSAIVVLCLDAAGQPEADVEVDFRIVTVPSGSQNIAYKGAKQTATSDVDGIARFEAVQGITGEWKRGRADVWTSVAVDSDSVTNVTSVIGSP
jgi:hypothetical protein